MEREEGGKVARGVEKVVPLPEHLVAALLQMLTASQLANEGRTLF